MRVLAALVLGVPTRRANALADDVANQRIVNPEPLGDGFKRFYGEATSSSSYGGYGGNENNFDKFKVRAVEVDYVLNPR